MADEIKFFLDEHIPVLATSLIRTVVRLQSGN